MGILFLPRRKKGLVVLSCLHTSIIQLWRPDVEYKIFFIEIDDFHFFFSFSGGLVRFQ